MSDAQHRAMSRTDDDIVADLKRIDEDDDIECSDWECEFLDSIKKNGEAEAPLAEAARRRGEDGGEVPVSLDRRSFLSIIGSGFALASARLFDVPMKEKFRVLSQKTVPAPKDDTYDVTINGVPVEFDATEMWYRPHLEGIYLRGIMG